MRKLILTAQSEQALDFMLSSGQKMLGMALWKEPMDIILKSIVVEEDPKPCEEEVEKL